jgi:hypothetical protein
VKRPSEHISCHRAGGSEQPKPTNTGVSLYFRLDPTQQERVHAMLVELAEFKFIALKAAQAISL